MLSASALTGKLQNLQLIAMSGEVVPIEFSSLLKRGDGFVVTSEHVQCNTETTIRLGEMRLDPRGLCKRLCRLVIPTQFEKGTTQSFISCSWFWNKGDRSPVVSNRLLQSTEPVKRECHTLVGPAVPRGEVDGLLEPVQGFGVLLHSRSCRTQGVQSISVIRPEPQRLKQRAKCLFRPLQFFQKQVGKLVVCSRVASVEPNPLAISAGRFLPAAQLAKRAAEPLVGIGRTGERPSLIKVPSCDGLPTGRNAF